MSEQKKTNNNKAEEIGLVLLEARKKLNYTKSDVRERIKIREHVIESIEKGDLSFFGNKTTVRGFVKSYASFLKISASVLPLLNDVLPEEGQEKSHYESNHILKKRSPHSRKISLISIILFLILLFSVIFFWQRQSSINEQQKKHILENNLENESIKVDPVLLNATTENMSENDFQDKKNTDEVSQEDSIVDPVVVKEIDEKEDTDQVKNVVNTQISEDKLTSILLPQPIIKFDKNLVDIKVRYRSYLEVKDSSGILINKIVPAGYHFQMKVNPPFDVKIGYSTGSSVSYEGKEVDIKPFIREKTATFSFSE